MAGGCRAGYYDLCLFVKIKHRGNMRSKLSQVGYYNHNVKVWYIFFLQTVYDIITYDTSSRYQGFVASSTSHGARGEGSHNRVVHIEI